jgi:hypothetical protein
MTVDDKGAEKKREKRTIAETRDSKRTSEKMVYMSVPDHTSAKRAEMAGSTLRWRRQYVKEVKEGSFPDDDHSYTVNEAEYQKLATMVANRRHYEMTVRRRAGPKQQHRDPSQR